VKVPTELVPANIPQPRDLRFDLKTADGQSTSVLVPGPFAKGDHDLGDVVSDAIPLTPPLIRIELRVGGRPWFGRAYVDLYTGAHEPAKAVFRRDGAVFEFYGPAPAQGVYAVCRSGGGRHHQTPLLTPGTTHVVDL
jgi:hypothetical protein